MTTAIALDLAAFEKWSNGLAKNEHVEVFSCKKCGSLFVGLPDSHIGYSDASDPRKTFTYNVPRKVSCPSCRTLWYGGPGSPGYETKSATEADVAASPWKWLLGTK